MQGEQGFQALARLDRADHVAAFRIGRYGHQIGEGGDLGEVLLQKVGRGQRVDQPVLQRRGGAIFPVQHHQMIDGRQGLILQGVTLGRCRRALHGHDHFGGMLRAPRADVFGRIADMDQGQVGAGRGDKGPKSLDPPQDPFARQFRNSSVSGHAADAERRHQFMFRRDAMTGRPRAAGDVGDDAGPDLALARSGGAGHGLIIGHGGLGSFGQGGVLFA